MLSRERAQYYYKSLLFNHYESGGTCEQRVLVLRARFDRILEELFIKDIETLRDYKEKLNHVFKALSNNISEENKKECHALRRYLNGVQHSTFEADESQYRLSVKRLCELINICSNEEIPLELNDIWKNQEPIVETKKWNGDRINKNIKLDSTADKKELPVVLCIDCSIIEDDEKKRNQFNSALRSIISRINDELDVNLILILIGKNKIKCIITKTGKKIISNYKKVSEKIIVYAINNSCDFIESRIKFYNDNNYKFYKPSGLAIFMLTSEVAGLIRKQQRTLTIEQQGVQIIPVGLTSGMDKESFSNLTQNNTGEIMKDGCYEIFFSWVYDHLKMICNK